MLALKLQWHHTGTKTMGRSVHVHIACDQQLLHAPHKHRQASKPTVSGCSFYSAASQQANQQLQYAAPISANSAKLHDTDTLTA
jgi:hypothetical protein